MTEPLPCPFCGHVGVTHSEGSTFRWLVTECNGCGAQCGEERINTMTMERSAAIEQAKEAAIKTWNTRAALEQQAESPPEWPLIKNILAVFGLDAIAFVAAWKAAQQQAEPVAYFDFQELKFSWAKHMKIGPVPMSVKVEPMKLYSESTKRQWVGLTDEEFHYCIALKNTTAIAEEVEAKLKERNT